MLRHPRGNVRAVGLTVTACLLLVVRRAHADIGSGVEVALALVGLSALIGLLAVVALIGNAVALSRSKRPPVLLVVLGLICGALCLLIGAVTLKDFDPGLAMTLLGLLYGIVGLLDLLFAIMGLRRPAAARRDG